MLHQFDAPVNTGRTTAHTYARPLYIVRNGERWYFAPDTLHLDKPRVAGKEVQPGNIFRSTRSYDGRRYDADCLNIAVPILNLIEQHGLHRVQVVIKYKNHETTYETTTAMFREHGEYQSYSGGQIALARHYWTADGKPIAAPEPEATQGALFDFAEPVQRRGGRTNEHTP